MFRCRESTRKPYRFQSTKGGGRLECVVDTTEKDYEAVAATRPDDRFRHAAPLEIGFDSAHRKCEGISRGIP
jgi:hypothetical protein